MDIIAEMNKTKAEKILRVFNIHEIRGKDRPRFNRRGKPRTTDETRRYEAKIRHRYNQKYRDHKLFQGAVMMQIEVFRKRNKNDYRKIGGKRTNQLRPAVGEYPQTTPDLSNIIKVIEDALNGVAYKDDRQVVRLIAISKYNTKERAERITVSIMPLEGIDK